MDQIEKYIKENKAEFDVYEPSPSLWQNLESRLPKEEKHQTSIIQLITKIAAILVIILIAGVGIGYFLGNKNANRIENSTFYTELNAAETYFNKEVDVRVKMVNALPDQNNEAKADLMQLEEVYQDLKSQLLQTPQSSQEVIIHEMIENYRIRIDLLEKILSKTKKIYNNEDTLSI